MSTTPFFVLAGVLLAVWFVFVRRSTERSRIRRSRTLLKKIRTFDSPQRIFAYLRQVDPFVFEELLLTCFEERGLVIKRNKRYTGDGGSDGQVYLAGRMMHIQAKRYVNHIKREHVAAFLQLVQSERTKGIFIHTGRTGKASRTAFDSESIDCVSGSKLIALLLGGNLTLHGVTLEGRR